MHVIWVLLYRDQWVPVWPNLEASALWTWPILAWHHRRIRRHVDRRMNELREETETGDQ